MITRDTLYLNTEYITIAIMITYEPQPLNLPPKKKLILLSSLAITIFFSLPRLGFWHRVNQLDLGIEFELLNFFLRSCYVFFIAVFFFWVNLEVKTINMAGLSFNIDKWLHRLFLNFILLVIVNVILINIHLALFEPYLQDRLFRALFAGTNILVVTFTMLGSYIYSLIFRNHQIALTNEYLQKQNAEARYDALKNQLNPHFLFNSLNTLMSLILSEKQNAVDFVGNMSDVYRYVLKTSKQDVTTIQEELQFLNAYSDILIQRHTDKLTININVDPLLYQHKVPPMALQLLVENAIKHNIISGQNPLDIRIFSTSNGEISVSNNLQKRKVTESSTRVGLYNLSQRYHYLANKEITITETSETFTVTIPLLSHEDINH